MRAWVAGTCVAVAVAFPAVFVARILDAVLEDDVPGMVTILLLTVVLAGPVAGGAAGGRWEGTGFIGAGIGATCLFLVAGFEAIRRGIADESVQAWTIPGADRARCGARAGRGAHGQGW